MVKKGGEVNICCLLTYLGCRRRMSESESRKDLPGERTVNKAVNFLLPMQTIYNVNSENRNKALRSHYVTLNHRLGLIHPL